MAQVIDTESHKYATVYPTWGDSKVTYSEPDAVPPIISKKWLCGRFGCQYPGGRFNYNRLHRLVLTSDVLQEIGLSAFIVRKPTFREFDAVASQKLKTVLNL